MIRTIIIITSLILITGPVTSINAQDLQESPEKTYQTALQLFQEGLFAEAIPRFRQVTRETDNVTILESAGYYLVLAIKKIDPELAEEKVNLYVSEHPHSRRSGELLAEIGHEYKQNGDYRTALNWFERAVDMPMTNNRQVELLYQMAETAASDESYDESRRYFLKIADEHPNSRWAPRALYARGRLFLEQEQFENASTAFEILSDRYPDDAMTRRIGTALGESYYLQRRYADAIEALEEALPYLTSESRTKAVYLMAESYNMLNNLEEASRHYRFFLNRVDDEHEARLAHYGLGWVFHKQGMYHWAAESFARAAFGDDETARKALYYKGANEKMASRYRSALDTFREFGNKYTEGVFVEEAYYEWAHTAFEVGRYVEAIEVLLPLARRLDELNDPGKIVTFLGEAYYANAEYTRALEAFEIAEELTDVDPAVKRQARFQRAWVQYSNQAYQQAQPQFEDVHNSAPSGSELGGEALFWSADSHYQIRNFGPASQQYARFINQYPDHELTGAAKYGLGWSYFMMGDFAQAIDPFIDFYENYDPPSIALYPYDTDVQLRIGDSYFALGEYQQAMEYYNMAIGAEPGGDYAMFQVANSYYRMNRNFEAVTEFRRVLRIYPFSSLREQAQYNVAYIYLNTGNYEQAINEFQTVIERFPNTEWAARSQYNIGDAYYNAGDYDNAIYAYSEVLENYPTSNYILEAIDGIQYAQLTGGSQDSSTDILEEFLSRNPTSETADRLRYRQAQNRYQAGDFDAAVDEFRQYIRITNRQDLLPDAYFNLGDSHVRMNNHDQAVESYQTIVDEFPDSDRTPAALERLGEIKYDQGEYNASLQHYRQLRDMGSRFHQQAYLGMGKASLAMNNISDAENYYNAILETTPDNDAARLGLANVRFAQDRYVAARELYADIAESSTTDIGAEAQYMLGRTFQEDRRFDEALQEYSRVSVLFEAYIEWVADARYRSAEIHIAQGNRGEAINVLNSIRDNFPGTEAAERAHRLLERN